MTGKTTLEENGSNLSIILSKIADDSDSKRRFLNMIVDLLPFVKDLNVQRLVDKSLLFTIQEQYADATYPYLPAAFVSDGTVNIAALLCALFFDPQPVIIIEEPERNIHPHLISKIVNMFSEVSKSRQIFVTTHNPEIVRHAPLDTLLLLARDNQGFSRVSRPHENETVRVFLKNEMGMDALYVQDLLGVPDEPH